MEYSDLDSICFSDFLNRFSKNYPKSINLIFLDGSGGHTAKKIKIPKNVILYIIPPYSPELNPKERVWQELKKEVSDELFTNLDGLRTFLYDKINKLSKLTLKSLSFYPYIRDFFEPKFPYFYIGV
jgi:transposase